MKEYPKEDLEHTDRPWGYYDRYTLNRRSSVKIHTFKKGGEWSLQTHKFRDEMWIPLDNGFRIEIGGKVTEAKPEQIFFVPRETRHKVFASNGGRLLEICFGEFDEADEVRYEDKYGRAGTNR